MSGAYVSLGRRGEEVSGALQGGCAAFLEKHGSLHSLDRMAVVMHLGCVQPNTETRAHLAPCVAIWQC